MRCTLRSGSSSMFSLVCANMRFTASAGSGFSSYGTRDSVGQAFVEAAGVELRELWPMRPDVPK